MSNYKATIGIEVHLELKTKTKVFSPTLNNYDSYVNSNVCEIDLGYPGVLPTLNKKVVNTALRAALGLNCSINRKMFFDRKNYFYPDLPKGYQITQARTPIGHDGYVSLGDGRKVGIERIHIEEDTAKSLHSNGRTLLNYNRAGVPLVEIVSKPDMHSAEDAVKYLERLRELMFYLDISDCKIEEGSMRCDVNVSISDSDILGVKCEVKNIGSITNVGIAIDSEIKRQSEILDNGGIIEEETRKFDSKTNGTLPMRKKEIGNEYRYHPEPDIPYVYISDKMLDDEKNKLVLLPDERRSIYLNRGILDINVEKIINNKEISDYLNLYLDTDIDFKIASNILLGDISAYLNKNKITLNETKLYKEKFIELVNMLTNGDITSKIFKDILNDVLELDLSIKDILDKNNISLMNNNGELKEIIIGVLKENISSVNDYKNGKENAIKFLMGMCMKATHGSANPKVVNEMLLDLLSKDV